MATRMQQRRGTAAQWTSANPVLNAGEMGWESDTNKFKIGDGTNHWASLDYFSDINGQVELTIGNSLVFEGATADSFETTIFATDPTADRTITMPDATGTMITTGNLTAITNLTNPAITGAVFSDSSIVFEGATADAFETTLTVTDPTADRTILFPDATGTIITTGNLSDIVNTGVFTSSIVFEGTTANDFELTLAAGDPTADRTVSFPDAAGTIIIDSATQTLTNKTLTTPQVSGLSLTDASIIREGSTPNDFETTLLIIDPSADRTITFPDVTGTVAVLDATQTLTNKTISLASNTVTSTLAQLNTAVSDADVASLAGSETLTNKTIALGSNTVSGTIAEFNTAVTDQDLATLAGSETLTNKTISFSSNTLTGVAPLAAPALTGDASAVNLTISGNLTVNGTTTNLNSTNLVVEDKNIILADVDTPTDITADGGGITIKGATDKTFNWIDATDAFTSSEHINLASGKSYYLNGGLLKDATETLTNKTLTSPKINLGINAQTGTTYTFVLADDGKFVTASNASAITVTIPPISSEAYPVGAQLSIVQKGAGQVTFAQGAGVTIRSTGATATAPKLRVQYSSATAVHEGSDIWYVVGDIA
jgi:hypothetical protein